MRNASVAQLAEQRFRKPQVTSSTLVAGFKSGLLSLRSRPSAGSNPDAGFCALWAQSMTVIEIQDYSDKELLFWREYRVTFSRFLDYCWKLYLSKCEGRRSNPRFICNDVECWNPNPIQSFIDMESKQCRIYQIPIYPKWWDARRNIRKW